MLFATVGAETPHMLLASVAVQSGRQVLPPLAQPTANAESLPSPEPTYTTPFATAAVETSVNPATPVHSGVHEPPPLAQPTAKAYSLAVPDPSSDPMYTTPFA